MFIKPTEDRIQSLRSEFKLQFDGNRQRSDCLLTASSNFYGTKTASLRWRFGKLKFEL
jgi:hypothetical protein